MMPIHPHACLPGRAAIALLLSIRTTEFSVWIYLLGLLILKLLFQSVKWRGRRRRWSLLFSDGSLRAIAWKLKVFADAIEFFGGSEGKKWKLMIRVLAGEGREVVRQQTILRRIIHKVEL